MINLNEIADDLFNKIRSRYTSVTMGDENGKVTSEPSLARFIDFEYKSGAETLGHVNVSLSEDEGLVVYYSTEFVSEESAEVQKDWYNFLRELRVFSKKRMLNFDTRDITKSNLDKRDYQFLAKNTGETQMSESKLHGTSRRSYQDLGGATLMVTHSKPVNTEVPGGRSMYIENIFIENADGERFKYPLKHLNGARALGRHIANGGTPYDSFGSHIVEMSTELGKLRKFKTYLGRSGVMAEAMGPVSDRVNERIEEIKKEVQQLQRESYYKEVIEGFEGRELSEVPEEVSTTWVEALTIKTFEEELKDVFPYIYKLVGEAKELGPEDLEEGFWGKLTANSVEDWAEEYESGPLGDASRTFIAMRDKYKGTEWEAQVACRIKSFEDFVTIKERMPQGANGRPLMPQEPMDWLETNGNHKCASAGQNESYEDALESAIASVTKKYEVTESNAVFSDDEGESEQALKKLQSLVGDHFPAGVDGMNAIESLQGLIDDPQLNDMFKKVGEKDADMCVRPLVNKFIKAKNPELLSKLDFGDMTSNTEPKETDVTVGKDGALALDGEEEQKTPLGEFILSYYDRETGQFPKGETAVLTAVEKDYGDQYVKPAQAFISKVNERYSAFKEAQEETVQNTGDIDRIKGLAGL